MISLLSTTDIAIDLEKLTSGQANKLLIVGESGAGKSTAAKYFATKLNLPSYSTDTFFWEYRELRKTNPEEYRRKRREYELGLIISPETCIIEGAGIHRMPLELTLALPVVILGKSGIRGAIDAGRRNTQLKVNTGKFWPEFSIAFKKNWSELSIAVKEFRQKRLSTPGSKVEIVEIPNL